MPNLPDFSRLSLRTRAAVLLCVTCLMHAGSASAQAWPERPVRWFNGAAPGASPDIIARLLADQLSAQWKQPVITDNRPGAAGNIAAQAAARASPDGYNYLFGVASTLAVNPFTLKAVPFDVERDFAPVALIGLSPFMIAVNPTLPVTSMAELITLAKAKPSKLTFATPASRNLQHITGELLKHRAGIDMLNIPYKGSPAAAQDTIAGQTDIYIDSVPAMAAHVSSGRLRVIAVTSPRRVPGFDSIPTVSETMAGFAAVGWFALLAPAGTPAEVIFRVNRDVNAVLAQPETAQRLHQLGVFDGGGTPNQLQRFLRSEREQWQRVIRDAGIEPE